MKSYKEYLSESKKVYEFKVKIAGDLGSDAAQQIKQALEKYKVENCSKGVRTPIQESPIDFPEQKNVNVTVFDLSVCYPTTSVEIREAIASSLNLKSCCIKVRNLKEQEEEELNHQYDEKSGKALLGSDYEASDNQKLVGNSQLMTLLKELNKVKHKQEQCKGINDELLSKNAPSEKQGPASKTIKPNNTSVIGATKVTLPTAKTAKGK